MMNCKRLLLTLFCLALSNTVVYAQYKDRVLVIVNEDVITQSEFEHRYKTVSSEIKQKESNATIPADFPKQVLEGMVSDLLQLQEAERRGIEANDQELAGALQRFAQQQELTLEQLEAGVESQGQSYKRFGETLRDSITLSRLTEYYARTRVIVPDYEIDGFIAQNNLGEEGSEYNIAHILINNDTRDREFAQQVWQELSDGMDFSVAAARYSDATDAQEGGAIGWRKLAQLPEVFQQGVKEAQVGGITGVLESENSFHILKLIEFKGDRTEIIQANVRHILISASSRIAKVQATKRMRELRQRILNGEDFSKLARIYSDDSVSAANGGELGWVSPGEMVPQFENTYTQMPLTDVSEPFETQYGVHILEVMDRREKNITDQMVRTRAGNILRRQRAEREFQQWVRQLREQAYIEHVSAPV